jgi:UDP:flavonoid glycosyltransferase YjiC (YdhE family)
MDKEEAHTMARILIATAPVAGHVTPGLRICRTLVSRGHEVWWYTGRKYQRAVERSGARFVAMQHARDYDDAELDREFPGRALHQGLAQLRFDLIQLFVDPIPAQVADLQRISAEQPFDVMLHDVGFLGMGPFAERSGIAYATYGISALTYPSVDTAPFGLGLGPTRGLLGRLRNRALQTVVERGIFRSVQSHYEGTRRRVGVGPSPTGWLFADAMSPHAFLQGCTPGFEYPRTDMPAQVQFVGPFLPPAESNFVEPAWWSELRSGRPVVHVTQGTVATSPEQLIVPTLRALRGEDVLVVATTGRAPAKELSGYGPNARIEQFVPYAHFMPHVDVMITNAGYGGVQSALAQGIPLIAAGASEDKPEIARRIAWSGVGIDLRTGTPTPERIREAFRTLLSDSRYRQNARRLRDEIAQTDAPTRAAEVIEQLAGAGPRMALDEQREPPTMVRHVQGLPSRAQTGAAT